MSLPICCYWSTRQFFPFDLSSFSNTTNYAAEYPSRCQFSLSKNLPRRLLDTDTCIDINLRFLFHSLSSSVMNFPAHLAIALTTTTTAPVLYDWFLRQRILRTQERLFAVPDIQHSQDLMRPLVPRLNSDTLFFSSCSPTSAQCKNTKHHSPKFPSACTTTLFQHESFSSYPFCFRLSPLANFPWFFFSSGSDSICLSRVFVLFGCSGVRVWMDGDDWLCRC